jgi:hypothetical protein
MVSVGESAARRMAGFETTAVQTDERDGVQWSRLLWVAPLTVIVSLLANLAIKVVVQALDPGLADMGQLGRPLVTLTLEGAILGVLAFALIAWLLPRPIRAYRIVAVIALFLSLIPDLLLGFGGDARRLGSWMMGPFFRLASLFPGSSAGGGRPAGGPTPAEALPAMPWERVLILILLHVATAAVCIVLLTTLTRAPGAPDEQGAPRRPSAGS